MPHLGGLWHKCKQTQTEPLKEDLPAKCLPKGDRTSRLHEVRG